MWNCTIQVAKTKALINDQLRSYCEADLRLCFRYAGCWFSHEAAHLGHKLLMLMELFPSSKNNVETYRKKGAKCLILRYNNNNM